MIAVGWRVHSWWADVVAVSGPASAPTVAHRERVVLCDDPALQEAYHAAVGLPLDDVPAHLDAVREGAVRAACAVLERLDADLGGVAAVGVVGGDRRLPDDVRRVLGKHALLHAAERDLYERAVIDAATTQAGHRAVATIPATGTLLADASRLVGVDLGPVLAATGKAAGPPWQKQHREAVAAALVALASSL